MTIILSLGAFLAGGEQRRHDEQVFEAWQVITNAHGQSGNGGRVRALEFLNSTPGTPGRRRWFRLPWARESLQGVDVSQAALVSVVLPRALLNGANLQSALLDGANLQRASLWDANLQNASLWDVNLRDADIHNANLNSTYLFGASLQKASLWDVNLKSADLRLADLKGTILRRANLKDAHLASTNLSDSYLGGANLQGAIFAGANLNSVYVGNANLLVADLRNTKNLISQQLLENENPIVEEEEIPLLCNTALPPEINNIDLNRDCDRVPQWLVDFSKRNNFVEELTLIEAQQIVDEARQKQWD